MQQSNKPFQTQVIYLFAILCGVLGAFLFLYSMSERKLSNSPKSISAPAPVSEIEKPQETIVGTETTLTEKIERAPAAKNLIETLTKLDPSPNTVWQVSEHSDGRPSHILGGHIPCADRDCDAKSVTAILEAIAATQDVKAKDLQLGSMRVGSNSYELEQYFAGYRVFNSGIKAFANASRTEVYHVTSDLRKIESAETNILISKAQAREKFAQKFSVEDPAKILFVVENPMVVGTTPTSNYLVWWLQYGQRFPTRRSIDAFVHATTGEITVRSDTK